MGTSPHHNHHHSLYNYNLLIKKLITRAIYALLLLALLHFYLFPLPFNQPTLQTPSPQPQQTPIPSSQSQEAGVIRPPHSSRKPWCDYSAGRWVPNSRAPLYNGSSCGTIKDGQNCMAHGRPDAGYLNWRWQPADGCNLRPFSPTSFLRLIRNKHLAFVGDSMARNQLESLLCLLATASPPELTYRRGDDNKFRRWAFAAPYNATVSVFWSPFLVKGVEKSAAPDLNHNKLYLDLPDEKWALELDKIDVLVFSVGHWFLHPAIYYGDGGVIGCHHCPDLNHTEIGFFDVFRRAFRTALGEIIGRRRTPEHVVVTTFSPAHFEGEWDKAGACPKKEPYKQGEKAMEYMDAEMRRIQIAEVLAAAAAVQQRGGELRIQALDVTAMALMRPDGHPGPYMYPDPFAGGPKERVQNDCVHWCLPGPIDTWNEILLEMMMKGSS